jgi:hypothetical protein
LKSQHMTGPILKQTLTGLTVHDGGIPGSCAKRAWIGTLWHPRDRAAMAAWIPTLPYYLSSRSKHIFARVPQPPANPSLGNELCYRRPQLHLSHSRRVVGTVWCKGRHMPWVGQESSTGAASRRLPLNSRKIASQSRKVGRIVGQIRCPREATGWVTRPRGFEERMEWIPPKSVPCRRESPQPVN